MAQSGSCFADQRSTLRVINNEMRPKIRDTRHRMHGMMAPPQKCARHRAGVHKSNRAYFPFHQSVCRCCFLNRSFSLQVIRYKMPSSSLFLRSSATFVSVLSLLTAPTNAYTSDIYALDTTYAGDSFFDGFDFYTVCQLWLVL